MEGVVDRIGRVDIRIIPARELTQDMAARWRAIQATNPELASPYFCPDYTRIIAAERQDVEVALIEEGGAIVAFFPFQREKPAVISPVGGGLADHEGLICAPGFHLDPRELVSACGAKAWDFEHLLASQSMFTPYHRQAHLSPVIDVSQGYDAYLTACPSVKAEQRKLRRMEREVGPLRFVAHSTDAGALNTVLGWKSQQYLATELPDGFANRWLRNVVDRVLEAQTENFAGTLSLLYAGDRLVAGHFGMRSASVWHWWFPAYDSQMARHSPGLILMFKTAEHAAAAGMRHVDLGKGDELYKARFSNGGVAVAQGSVELPSLVTASRNVVRTFKAVVADSPLEAPLRRLAKVARRA